MKRLVIAGLSLAFFAGTFALPATSSAVSPAQENTGCGLGAMLIGEKGNDMLIGQLAMTFLNVLLGNQTFGITSGTSNCKAPTRVVTNERLNKFVADNMDSLAQDIAMGRGESLDTLAELLSVPQEKKPEFYASLQTNFSKIYSSTDVQSADVIDSITDIKSN
ncbi:MAG: DUF3015 family protein [Deltaproteobacteria bacterium]|nr:DUF3015 family protein [Deltaproteobacteria bacterium]